MLKHPGGLLSVDLDYVVRKPIKVIYELLLSYYLLLASNIARIYTSSYNRKSNPSQYNHIVTLYYY